MSEKSRPILIAIIAILTILAAIICIIGGLGLALSDIAGDIDFGVASDILSAAGAGVLIIGIVMLIVGIGIWKGWSIMWYIAVIIYGISLILSIISLIMMLIDGVDIGAAFIVPFIICILILYYLFRPKVKAFFGIGS